MINMVKGFDHVIQRDSGVEAFDFCVLGNRSHTPSTDQCASALFAKEVIALIRIPPRLSDRLAQPAHEEPQRGRHQSDWPHATRVYLWNKHNEDQMKLLGYTRKA